MERTETILFPGGCEEMGVSFMCAVSVLRCKHMWPTAVTLDTGYFTVFSPLNVSSSLEETWVSSSF